LAQSPNVINSVQLTINLSQPAAVTPPARAGLIPGTWVRTVVEDTVRISFIPDDFATPSSHAIQVDKDDPADNVNWERFFEDPKTNAGRNVDINGGTILLRLSDDALRGTAVWLPKSAAQDPVQVDYQKPTLPPSPATGGTGLAQLLDCMSTRVGDYASCLRSCAGQLWV
jgi:hypothetical protein